MLGSTQTVLIVLLLLGISCLAANQGKANQNYVGSTLEAAIGDFSQSLYIHQAKTAGEGNFVFSPLSLHSALSLLYLGTKDNSTTREQLMTAMGIVNSPSLLAKSYNRVIQTYKNQKSFTYANHIWVGNGFSLKQDYQDLVSQYFGSEVSSIRFDSEKAVKDVNQWISDETNNKIQNLVESFSPDMKMFLANALYFNEKWLEPFDERDYQGNTIEEYFDTPTGRVKVPMIEQIGSNEIIYGEIDTGNIHLEVVTIPYENEGFEMQIIIPKDAKQFHILENEMTLRESQDDKSKFNVFKAMKKESFVEIEDVTLKMPMFKVKTKFDAVEALKSLGAKDIFTSSAELDKIASGGPLSVGKIIHEAVVEVTKEGTEGAAATGIELVLFSASFGERKNIVLDRPFIFIVQDKVNNIPVMVGRIKNPSQP